MNQIITQKFQSTENLLLISGSIVDVMNNFRNITKQETPALYRVNLNEYSYFLKKTLSFSKLDSNWDSYNAEVISNIAIDSAKEILDYLNINGLLTSEIEINIFPMRDGGIQFEFDEKYICAEIEINPNGNLTFIQFDDDGNILEDRQFFKLSELSNLLEDAQYV